MSRALGLGLLAWTTTLVAGGAPDAIDPARLADGDLVLRHAAGRWSNYFRDSSPVERRFSHIGIVVREVDGWNVIHADASDRTGVGCVRREPLDVFLREAVDWAVFRVSASEEQRTAIAGEARAFLGVPFDAEFNPDDASRVYCTELVYHTFRSALGPAVIPRSEHRGRGIVYLDSCYLGPRFTMVAERSRVKE